MRAVGSGGRRARPAALVASLAVAASLAAALTATGSTGAASARTSTGTVATVAAENQYGDVLAAIGGRFVSVDSIVSNPNVDPHSFEASVKLARTVAGARLVVQNGLGYDGFMGRIEAAAPNRHRLVVDVQRLLRLPSSTRNPHLWYRPSTMPAVARAVATALSRIEPSHAQAFRSNRAAFDASLRPWRRATAALRARFAGTPVAVTEPVADDLLRAAGLEVRTPWVFQADVMNGVDPAPQALQAEEDLLSHHEVRALLYNEQVTDPVTSMLLALAETADVPVVALYETMPAGYHYGAWMAAETRAIGSALSSGRSTRRL